MGAENGKFVGVHEKEQVFSHFAGNISSGKVKFFESVGIDFVMGSRYGPYLTDLTGEVTLIDCHCNGGVFNLGHRNPEIVQTLQDSLAELDIGNHHLISEQRAALANRLAELAPGDLPYTVFGVGGGEAVDLAVKIARGHTGRETIISAKGAYHGHTGFALAAGDEKYRAPFGPSAPGFIQVPFNDLAALEDAVDDRTAAVMLETVPATYGVAIPEEDYLPRVRSLCDSRGALLIVDEIQTGLGRSGKLWGIEHFDVEPDIMVTGKGLSGGIYPVSATCFRTELESVFHDDPFIHVSTFGGAEVGCPVALRVLEISSDPEFLSHVVEISALFSDGFQELQVKHPEILIRLRQLGLMMGIEMANEMCGPLFTKAAYETGFLSVYANNDTRVAQFLPPLIIDRALAEDLLLMVDQALHGVKSMLGL
ncbi:MAG: aminotransferase class III-fold pyridoxal phosphate-dependent enzyme [Anaerolineales bacterium]|nr:aminotransferase class III-fold pyridoxal phosphate-dependent enzyme [Anaerolineales bacterium]